MNKYQTKLPFLSLVLINSLFLNTIASAETLDEAKKAHPNADFKVNSSDGSFTYTYGNNNESAQTPKNNTQSSNANPRRNSSPSTQPNQSPQVNTPQENHGRSQQSQNSLSIQPQAIQPESNNVTLQPPPPRETAPSVPVQEKTIPSTQNISTNAYGKDERGFINSINVDLLYDELSLQEFNKKARTPEGKPLAMDNGKIISNPNFTNKNNLYTPGQCTYYVFDKRAADGNTISTFWGDAKNWASQAKAAGFRVDNQPEKGAVFQTPIGVWGHVAYVERVNIDGSIFISEMNFIAPYITSTRTISAAEAKNYNYIH